jgi:uncharacterized membrane protein YidH (DUF202 family)
MERVRVENYSARKSAHVRLVLHCENVRGIATVRVSFGLVLISVASASRTPRALRVLGYVILIPGITTALAGLLEIGRAHTTINSNFTWQLDFGAAWLVVVVLLAGVGLLRRPSASHQRGA